MEAAGVAEDAVLPGDAPARDAVIDLDAIAANTAHGVGSAAIAGIDVVLADVRSNAYGHGLIPVAHTVVANGATGLLVSSGHEGASLRAAGITVPIHVIRPVVVEPELLAQHSLIPAIATEAELLAAVATGSEVIDLDLTDPPGGLSAVALTALSMAIHDRVLAGTLSISAVFVEDSALGVEPGGATVVPSREGVREAVQRLLDALAELGSYPSVVVNGPIDRLLTGATSPGTAVELGASLYGLVPASTVTAAELGLRVAMTLSTRVSVVKAVAANEGVSYGYVYRTKHNTTVALCSFGYADGIHRSAGTGGVVWCNGRIHPMAGRVAMDVFMMDAEGHDVRVGDRVVLFGDPALGFPSPDEWARGVAAESPAVISSLGPRVTRRYVGGPDSVRQARHGDTLATAVQDRLGVEAVVDLTALQNNLVALRSRVAPSGVMLVVKDDAYCHGAVEVVRAAIEVGIDRVGTFDVATAVALRRAGIGAETTLFAWMVDDPADYVLAREHSIDVGVSQQNALDDIAALPSGPRVSVHLKIDTGLHRNGANPEDWPALVDAARELESRGVITVESVWTHIAEASDDEDSLSIDRFSRAVSVARERGLTVPLRHLAASAAGFEREDARFDLVRFGAFSFGIPPTHSASAADMGLSPVMALSAMVLRIVESADGQRLGLLGFGSGDGLLSGTVGTEWGGSARSTEPTAGWRGLSLPVVGRPGLDRCWIDCGDSGVAVGDWVRLWGDGRAGESTLQEWGESRATMGEEIVLRLPNSVPKRYVTR